MKALLSRQPGPPETLTLEEVPDLAPKPGQAVIRVEACGANFPDVLLLEDRYQIRPPRPFSPGAEVAGIVESVGEGVTVPKVGDRVMAICSWGGMAEQLAVEAERCLPVPGSMPLDDAAALQLTYGTAYYGLKESGRLGSGDTLLVLGAAGGVGLAAVEIGKALGARVIAAVSTEAKATFAREAGADETVIYPRGPFDKAGLKDLAALFKGACGAGANVILDPVGGDYAEAALRSIAKKGRYVIAGFTAGIPRVPFNLVLFKDAQIVGAPWGAVVAENIPAYKKAIDELLALYEVGKIKPRIALRLPLERAQEGLERLLAREAVGKIVITMDGGHGVV